MPCTEQTWCNQATEHNKKKHPDFYLCTDWEEIKKNINTHKAQRNGKRYMGRDRPTLDTRAPAENADPLRQPSYARQAASRVHNRTSQQGSSYARNASTHRCPQRSSTTSLPRTASELRAPSHFTPTRPAAREREAGWGNEEGAPTTSTYAAAVRRNHVSYYRHPIETSGAGRWNRNHSPQYHPSTPLSETLHVHSGNSQYPYEDIEKNRCGNVSNYITNKNYERRRTGCYNCGEFNHVSRNCRFDHKLLCSKCKRFGHKSRLCQSYNT